MTGRLPPFARIGILILLPGTSQTLPATIGHPGAEGGGRRDSPFYALSINWRATRLSSTIVGTVITFEAPRAPSDDCRARK
ncbi:hypothetical protein CGLAMM_03465 [Acetobacteraceae bacterium EV16G]